MFLYAYANGVMHVGWCLEKMTGIVVELENCLGLVWSLFLVKRLLLDCGG